MHSSGSIITAQTFTPYYSQTEDRIRLVVNYTDFTNRIDFWITRAFLLKLAPSWEEYYFRYASHQKINTDTHESSSETAATDNSTLSVTEKAGVLLEAVDMTFDNSTETFEIRLRGSDTQAVAVLSEEMMMTLIKTIFNAAPHMQWGISPALLAC